MAEHTPRAHSGMEGTGEGSKPRAVKAITFLGAGSYVTTKYTWGEKWCETDLFPEAVFNIFEPDVVYLLTTEKAKSAKRNGRTYCEILKEKIGERLRIVDIPEGANEGELWKIFDIFSGIVEEGDELIIDITHAFRSLPLFVFLAAYMHSAKGTRIGKVIYGAYEARDKNTNTTPIFDLTPLVDLTGWITGAEALVLRGDASMLADMLQDFHAVREKGVAKWYVRLANKLRFLSKALSLNRPTDVMSSANELKNLDLCDRMELPGPFLTILDTIRKDVSKLAYPSPRVLSRENLSKQIEIIEYCLSKGMVVQAVMMAREWVVSFLCLKEKEEKWLDNKTREKKEEWLNGLMNSKEDGHQELKELWGDLRELRNDIAHCGMRENPIHIQKIERKAAKIPEELRSLLSSMVCRDM